MTKEHYFEMCEMLGSEPVEDEIPPEFDDLYTQIQDAFVVYKHLSDNWDGMSGQYLGKILTGVYDVFRMLEIPIEDEKIVYQMLLIIDSIRIKEIQKTRQATESAKKP